MLTICVGDSVVKVDIPGKVLCKYCNDVINYGSKGCVAIIDHLKFGKHASDHRQSNYTLGAQFSQKNAPPALFPLFKPPPPPPKQLNPAKDLDPPPAPKLIPLVGRTANMKSMILSFMTGNNLSFTLALKLVELLKECAADPKPSLVFPSLHAQLPISLHMVFLTFLKQKLLNQKQKCLLTLNQANEACFSAFKGMLIARF